MNNIIILDYLQFHLYMLNEYSFKSWGQNTNKTTLLCLLISNFTVFKDLISQNKKVLN